MENGEGNTRDAFVLKYFIGLSTHSMIFPIGLVVGSEGFFRDKIHKQRFCIYILLSIAF